MRELIKNYKNCKLKLSEKEKKKLLASIDINKDNLSLDELITYYILTQDIGTLISYYFLRVDRNEIWKKRELIQLLFTPQKFAQIFSIFFQYPLYDKLDNLQKKIMVFKYYYVNYHLAGKGFEFYYANLKKLFEKELSNRNEEIVLFLYIPLLYSGLNSSVGAKRFNEEIEKPLQHFFKEHFIPKYLIKPYNQKKKNGVLKVAFLMDRDITNSVNNFLYNLLLNLENSKKYDFTLLSLNYFEYGGGFDEVKERFQNLKIRYIDLHEKLECVENPFYDQTKKLIRLREFLLEQNFDILIANGAGHPTYNFLFTSRVAPKQFYWSHGNCHYDIEGIDKRISHFVQDCQEFEWKIFNVPMSKEFLIGSEEEKKEGFRIKEELKKVYGKDTVILGAIGRLLKIDSDEYLKVVSEIMMQNPNTIYLACGSGNQKSVENKLQKYGIDKERFLFMGHVNPHVFGWVIELYLAPFPLSAGQALEEYRRKNRPYIAMHSKEWLKRFKDEFQKDPSKLYFEKLYTQEEKRKAFSFSPLIEENKYAFVYQIISHVLDKEDYLNVSLRFLKDKELRDKVVEEYAWWQENNKGNINTFLKVLDD